MLTDQWFMSMESLAKRGLQAVDSGELRFVPENWTTTYRQWLENIQDWCVSRQLWWGLASLPGTMPTAISTSAHSEEEARKQAGGVELTQDNDVLDTWFSSALWPFSTLGWPETYAGTRTLPADLGPGHRLRHHLLLGRAHGDDVAALHR
jgi:valyl-tRNA synthetase